MVTTGTLPEEHTISIFGRRGKLVVREYRVVKGGPNTCLNEKFLVVLNVLHIKDGQVTGWEIIR